jgi:hypothetical protein
MTCRINTLAGVFLASFISISRLFAAAQLPEVTIHFVGTPKPTSFPQLLYVHVTNEGYAPLNLAQMLSDSTLMIDGKPSRHTDATFRGPQGLPPMGEWGGCLNMDSFTPPITPGRHKINLKIGNVMTAEVKVSWTAPVNWRQGDLKSRLKEIQELADSIEDGLPQSCVEQWLTAKDGGLADEDKVRYYLEPQFKMSVPYRKMYESSGLHSVVDGSPTVYKEQRLLD